MTESLSHYRAYPPTQTIVRPGDWLRIGDVEDPDYAVEGIVQTVYVTRGPALFIAGNSGPCVVSCDRMLPDGSGELGSHVLLLGYRPSAYLDLRNGFVAAGAKTDGDSTHAPNSHVEDFTAAGRHRAACMARGVTPDWAALPQWIRDGWQYIADSEAALVRIGGAL